MKVRHLIQLASLSLFFSLFFTAAYGLIGVLPNDLFVKASPFSALTLLFRSPRLVKGFLTAAVVLASALIAGRFFCGHICPLGSLMDAVGGVKREAKGHSPAIRHASRKLKYLVLAASLAAAAAGLSVLGWLDPLVILTRSSAVVLVPWVGGVWNFIGSGIESVFHVVGLNARMPLLQDPDYGLAVFSLTIVGMLLGLTLWKRRWWCRYVCPLGAMMALASRTAPIRRRVSKGCDLCELCERVCPMGAVSGGGNETIHSECILCMRCAEACPQGLVGFLPRHSGQERSITVPTLRLTRRGILAAAAVGFFLGLTSRVKAGYVKRPQRPVRPPGAIPEPDFLDVCIRCGLCVGACLTQTLEPCWLESGLEGMWTPMTNLRRAPCEPTCTRCGRVCPTGAIRALPLEERTQVCMGTAVILRELCIVWEQDKRCLVCDEVCPYGAIVFRQADGRPRPFVLEDRCTGCGQCEYHCPVETEAAIRVTPKGEIRLKSGSYKMEAKRRGRTFIFSEAPPGPEILEDKDEGLPKGFILDE